MASRKQEIRKEIKKKNAKNIMEKLFHFLQHLKKQKKALFQKLKVFSMMKENNLKN